MTPNAQTLIVQITLSDADLSFTHISDELTPSFG